MSLEEPHILSAMEREEMELSWRARLARTYEELVGQVTAAFRCILYAGGSSAVGAVTARSVESHSEVGTAYRTAHDRIGKALTIVAGQLESLPLPERNLAANTLAWLENGALDSPSALFHALLTRHVETQKRKPPDGKRLWIEGEAPEWFVRSRFVEDTLPPDDGQLTVHSYRTRAIRSCFLDLKRAGA